MPDVFEIVDKDLMGRIGRFYTPHGVVETPTVMPVINPNLRLIEPADLRKFGAQMLITNSYIIYRTERLREAALSKGLHSMLGFDGPIMTDSGSFQLSVYGSVEVDNPGIVTFERDIGTDIGVPLDIPTPPDVPYAKAREELEITLARMAEAKQYAGKMMLAGPVQGSSFLDLREEAARRAYETGFDLYPLTHFCRHQRIGLEIGLGGGFVSLVGRVDVHPLYPVQPRQFGREYGPLRTTQVAQGESNTVRGLIAAVDNLEGFPLIARALHRDAALGPGGSGRLYGSDLLGGRHTVDFRERGGR
jgi:hypothetical protein